jgi:hypothetical protein
MGSITETATSAPGQSSLRPNTKVPLAETLKLNGYSTAQFGKCHEVPVRQSSPMGPFDMWPSGGGGFEYFYGFIGGENNQWYPALYEDQAPIEPEKTPEEGYHLKEDLADHAIDWVRAQKALVPDKPFFIHTGLCYLPFVVGLGVAVGGVGPKLYDKLPARAVIAAGLIIYTGGLAWCVATLSPTSDYFVAIFPTLVVGGFGGGLVFLGTTAPSPSTVWHLKRVAPPPARRTPDSRWEPPSA